MMVGEKRKNALVLVAPGSPIHSLMPATMEDTITPATAEFLKDVPMTQRWVFVRPPTLDRGWSSPNEPTPALMLPGVIINYRGTLDKNYQILLIGERVCAVHVFRIDNVIL